MQLGVHFVDTVQYLLGNAIEVSSFMSHVATPADNNDVTVTLMRFENGLLGYLGSNYATPPVYYVNVYGVGGNLSCEFGGDVRYRKAGTQETEVISVAGVNSQLEELEEFAHCSLTGEKFEIDGEDGLRVLATIRAALKSSEENRPINVDELIAEARGH
jgi:predicted dehydrogenase